MTSVKKLKFLKLSLCMGIAIAAINCNMMRSSGKASFTAADKPGMGRLKLTGPSGWQCIEFEKTTTLAGSTELQVAGKGRGDCPLFGSYNFDSNSYPTSGNEIEIPADKPTLVYKNEAGNFEIYALVTKDKEAFAKIGK